MAQGPSGESTSGPDLLDTLFDELAKTELPTIHVVVGRAGIRKSFLFRALFARAYDVFLQAKAGLVAKPRPISPPAGAHQGDLCAQDAAPHRELPPD